MPHPFAQAPTVKEFADQLVRDLGCKREKLYDSLHGPRGPVQIDFLTRQHGGRQWESEPLPTDENERLCPDTLRRLIDQLKLPHSLWPFAGSPNDLDD